MKRILNWMTGVAAMMIALVALPDQQAKAQPGATVSFQMFYDELSPYGQWIDDPQYGYVWAPNVNNDFRPYYTNGRWVMTEYGNTWISNYNWGWAPFHYGRWTYDSYYGWIWVPGNEWGPAWVNWRSGGGYYGWAPLGPGISISLSFGNNYSAPYDWWTFIPYQHIYSPSYYSYWRGPQYNTTIINQTTIINNHYNNRYIYGPRRNDIERHTGGRVTVYNIRTEQRPGRPAIRRNEVAMYRPQVSQGPRSGARPAPRNAIRAERPIGNNNRDNRNAVNRDMPQRSIQTQPVERTNAGQRNTDRSPLRQNRTNQEPDNRVSQPDRSMRNDAERVQREQQMIQRQNEQKMQQERQRVERENNLRAQQEMAQRQNEQRIQEERQRAARENAQRTQMERVQRENAMRSRQQAEQRQQQIQREQQQRMQSERQQQQRQQQREWRRPEPQMQRTERPQMQRVERGQPSGDRGRSLGRGR